MVCSCFWFRKLTSSLILILILCTLQRPLQGLFDLSYSITTFGRPTLSLDRALPLSGTSLPRSTPAMLSLLSARFVNLSLLIPLHRSCLPSLTGRLHSAHRRLQQVRGARVPHSAALQGRQEGTTLRLYAPNHSPSNHLVFRLSSTRAVATSVPLRPMPQGRLQANTTSFEQTLAFLRTYVEIIQTDTLTTISSTAVGGAEGPGCASCSGRVARPLAGAGRCAQIIRSPENASISIIPSWRRRWAKRRGS